MASSEKVYSTTSKNWFEIKPIASSSFDA